MWLQCMLCLSLLPSSWKADRGGEEGSGLASLQGLTQPTCLLSEYLNSGKSNRDRWFPPQINDKV